ncbi:hypothetical protein ZWY2020_022838 [Hordeum vulgare]|nr:hypothetical protein ZWY2020_022838 [Hordeum vulgare]
MEPRRRTSTSRLRPHHRVRVATPTTTASTGLMAAHGVRFLSGANGRATLVVHRTGAPARGLHCRRALEVQEGERAAPGSPRHGDSARTPADGGDALGPESTLLHAGNDSLQEASVVSSVSWDANAEASPRSPKDDGEPDKEQQSNPDKKAAAAEPAMSEGEDDRLNESTMQRLQWIYHKMECRRRKVEALVQEKQDLEMAARVSRSGDDAARIKVIKNTITQTINGYDILAEDARSLRLDQVRLQAEPLEPPEILNSHPSSLI